MPVGIRAFNLNLKEKPLRFSLTIYTQIFISCFIKGFIMFKKKPPEGGLKINCYLSIPASAATEAALDLSTNPGPDGILSPGNRPAALLYKCNTTIGM